VPGHGPTSTFGAERRSNPYVADGVERMSVEIYVSTDVEADGPIPGPHSMLSFASAAYTEDKQLIATFSANLDLLDGATAHPVQEAWWKTQPEAWAACRKDLQQPANALNAYVDWVEALPGKPVFVAMPAGFDFTFMFWYMMRFTGRCPFSWSALDIKTLAFAMTGLPYRKCIKPRCRSAGSTTIRTPMSRSTMRSSKAPCSATCSRICALTRHPCHPCGGENSRKMGTAQGKTPLTKPAN
jgi:hypothetical protein